LGINRGIGRNAFGRPGRNKQGDRKMSEQYRIDYSTGQIFELNEDKDAYLFLCTFLQIGATSSNLESTIIRKIEEWKQQ
jgi:hypothetical protein